jgi:enolase
VIFALLAKQLVHNTIKAAEIPGTAFHCGVDVHSSAFYNSETASYFIDGPSGTPKTATELATYLASVLVSGELITYEDPLLSDHSAMKFLLGVSFGGLKYD